jgi:hypothetical protein
MEPGDEVVARRLQQFAPAFAHPDQLFSPGLAIASLSAER